MKATINRLTYDTATATLLADNQFSNNSANRLNTGRATSLYRTPKGRYFAHHETIWQGERDTIEPLTATEAEELYNRLPNKSCGYADAFPNVTVEEA